MRRKLLLIGYGGMAIMLAYVLTEIWILANY